MLFGPYTVNQVRELSSLLLDLKISFSVEEDAQLLESRLTEWKSQTVYSASVHGNSLDTSHLYLDIEEEELPRLGDRLENYGISQRFLNQSPPNLESDDYLCPKCQFHSFVPAVCPVHLEPLIDFQAFNAAKRERHVVRDRIVSFMILLLLIGLVFGAAYYNA